MPKGILEFNLPEESDEFYTATHGGDYKLVVWNFDQLLRTGVKHGSAPWGPLTDSERELFEKLRDQLREELDGLEI